MSRADLSDIDGRTAHDETGSAIIAAGRHEFVRFGFRRATMEDIARRAGVSRVTVYRRFPNKAGLLQAILMTDIAAFTARFDAVWYGAGPVATRVEDIAVLTVRELREYPLLTTVLRADPGAALKSLTLDGEAQFQMVRSLLSARIDGLVERGDLPVLDVARTAETMLRLAYTVVLLPFGDVPGRDEDDIRGFARDFLAPLVHGAHG